MGVRIREGSSWRLVVAGMEEIGRRIIQLNRAEIPGRGKGRLQSILKMSETRAAEWGIPK